MKYSLIPITQGGGSKIRYDESFSITIDDGVRRFERVISAGAVGGFVCPSSKLPSGKRFYIDPDSAVYDSDLSHSECFILEDVVLDHCFLEKDSILYIEKKSADRVTFSGNNVVTRMTASGITLSNIMVLNFGWGKPLPQSAAEPSRDVRGLNHVNLSVESSEHGVCQCDIRQLMSTGHTPGCPEAKRG